MKKKVKIEVGDLDQSAKRFVEAWKKAEKGKSLESQEYITFDDMETLLRVLTSPRWTLLRFLRREGPMRIRRLSKALTRNYKNVHKDVKALKRVGLAAPVTEDKVMVPWDTLLAEVRLEAAY